MPDLHLSIEQLHKYCIDMLRSVVFVCEKEGIPYYVIYGTLLGAIRHNGPIPWDPDVDLYIPENEINRFISVVEENLGDKYWVDYRTKGMIPKPFPRIGLKGYDTEILHIDIFRLSGLPSNKFLQRMLTLRGRSLWVLWKAKVINPHIYYKSRKKRVGAYLMKVLALPFSVKHIISTIDRLCSKIDYYRARYVGRVMGQRAIYDKSFFNGFDMHDFVDFKVRIPKDARTLLSIMYGNYLEFPPEEYQKRMMDRTFYIKEVNSRNNNELNLKGEPENGKSKDNHRR